VVHRFRLVIQEEEDVSKVEDFREKDSNNDPPFS
jgi:hypothetical protein